MLTYVIKGFKSPKAADSERFNNDLKSALRAAGKEQKVVIKKIKIDDDTVRFTVESGALVEKVVEAIKVNLGVEAKPAASPLSDFAETYGLTQADNK